VSYSTLSYELLAALVTRLSDRPYQDYLRERIFAPLGMADTSYDPRVSDSSAGVWSPSKA
jgi:CubicO group peptidase (beta-lactamase class C family)